MDKQFGQLNNGSNGASGAVGTGAAGGLGAPVTSAASAAPVVPTAPAMPHMQQAEPAPVTPPPVTMPSQPSIPTATPVPAPGPVVTTSAQPMFGAGAPAVGSVAASMNSAVSSTGSAAVDSPTGALEMRAPVGVPPAASPVASPATSSSFGAAVNSADASSPVASSVTSPATSSSFGAAANPAAAPSPVTSPVTNLGVPPAASLGAAPNVKRSIVERGLDKLTKVTGIEWNKANKILLILTIALAVGLVVALIYIIGFSGKTTVANNSNTNTVEEAQSADTTTSSNLRTVSCVASGDWYDLTQDFVINDLAKETVRTSIMIDADTTRSADFSEDNEDDAMMLSLLEMLSTTLAGFAGEPGVTFVTDTDGATYWSTDFSVTRSDNMSEELKSFAVIDGYTADELLGVVSQSGSLAQLGMSCTVE